ncbi:MAG: hypothetical protein M1823_005739 [Watsoniomyces obsoletus]|nr:MAG: hypothetical protein M1823_005739 [Watsoniomyces obsoletus]
MGLEDFEKALAEEQATRTNTGGHHQRSEGDKESRRHDRHHRRHHRSSKDGEDGQNERRSHRHKHDRQDKSNGHRDDTHEDDGHRRKHKRRRDEASPNRRQRRKEDGSKRRRDEGSPASTDHEDDGPTVNKPELQRDAWMEAPSALDVEYTHRPAKKEPERKYIESSEVPDTQEVNTDHDQNGDEPPQEDENEVDYTFGDAGSKWRMTKLKAVYTQAEDSGRPVDEIAIERYGSLRDFDNAREEQTEVERRKTYGEGYSGKDRPSGDVYLERLQQEAKLEERISKRIQQESSSSLNMREEEQRSIVNPGPDRDDPSGVNAVPLDQTALNRLKAQMMKAKLRGSPDFAKLEAEYNAAMTSFANRKEASNVVVLGPMESRMLAGARRPPGSQTTQSKSKTKNNDDDLEAMSIQEMIREERMTRGQAGGEGRRFAERIVKDGKFKDDLEYMDENASKLARRIEKSEISLKNTAIHELQKINRILDKCPLCHHEDTNKPPLAPIVSLATRVYLTLPTMPEISKMGAVIVPIQHRANLLECDDDEWEEIRNFMKCLKRMYHAQGRDVIFYEGTAATPERRKHAAMQVVPLPQGMADTAPAFFKEAILTTSAEWTQHRKLIDTLSRSRGPQGLGKLAFRRSLVKEMPYFHVWFELDGGLGHIVEDAHRWPRGDLFAREVIGGGMLGLGPDIVRRQGGWGGGGGGGGSGSKEGDKQRVENFRKVWKGFDWTGILTEQYK